MCASTDTPRRGRFLARLHPRRIRRDQDGGAAIEFALLLPPFFLMLYALIELGRAMWNFNTLQLVADEASRWASVRPAATAEDVRTAALPMGVGLKEDDLLLTVARQGPDAAGVTTVNVTLTYTFRPVAFLGAGGVEWQMGARGTMPVIENN
ncbi:TadE/TadG family type IV pilus assembly protein [Caenispirillum salinarum]|uniref:TadE/TadG family type IV pilus assembly protein n=1 Tax=Caenispirillum salinarum TaxID=859058 RepID=UPI00384C30AE